jgi:hypothetical protein
LVCFGFLVENDFIFRNENEAAQKNSQRARRGRRQDLVAEASSSVTIGRHDQQLQTTPDVENEVLQQHYLWLNERALAEIPQPLKRDVETRAVERFFVNWTLYPSNHGESPGKAEPYI